MPLTPEERRRLVEELLLGEVIGDIRSVPVSVSKTHLKLEKDIEPKSLLKQTAQFLEEYLYTKDPKKLKEGFTEPIVDENEMEVWYFKQSPRKVVIPKVKYLDKQYISDVLPPNRVYLYVRANRNLVEIYRFGGNDEFARKAIDKLLRSIKKAVTSSFETIRPGFSPSDMYEIMRRLGLITYINVDPMDNEKFFKAIERGSGKKPVLEYAVSEIMIKGYKITNSPKIREILREEKIKITELIGDIKYQGRKIKVWVKDSGKITFFLSPTIAGTDDEDEIKKYGIDLYEELSRIEEMMEGPIGLAKWGIK